MDDFWWSKIGLYTIELVRKWVGAESLVKWNDRQPNGATIVAMLDDLITSRASRADSQT